MKRFLKKNKDGEVVGFVTIFISMLIFFMLFLVLIHYSHELDQKDQVDQVTRKYIIKMEAKGYLEDADRDVMCLKLLEIGMDNIDLSGTTMSPVNYGEEITLDIKGQLRVTNFSMQDKLVLKAEDSYIPISNVKTSTAKN